MSHVSCKCTYQVWVCGRMKATHTKAGSGMGCRTALDVCCRPMAIYTSESGSSALRYTHCNILQHTATHCNTLYIGEWELGTQVQTLQHAERHCDTLQHTAIHCIHCNTLQHTATHCNTLQYTAIHCNTTQHTATRCNTLYIGEWELGTQANTLQHTATHCNTLQHTHKEGIGISYIGLFCFVLVSFDVSRSFYLFVGLY